MGFISKTRKILDDAWSCLKLLEGFFKYRQARLEVIDKSHKNLVLKSLECNLTIIETTWTNICITWTNITLLE